MEGSLWFFFKKKLIYHPSSPSSPQGARIIGVAFAATGAQRSGSVGAGVGHLMRARAVVDFAVGWLRDEGYGQ